MISTENVQDYPNSTTETKFRLPHQFSILCPARPYKTLQQLCTEKWTHCTLSSPLSLSETSSFIRIIVFGCSFEADRFYSMSQQEVHAAIRNGYNMSFWYTVLLNYLPCRCIWDMCRCRKTWQHKVQIVQWEAHKVCGMCMCLSVCLCVTSVQNGHIFLVPYKIPNGYWLDIAEWNSIIIII